MRDPLLHHPDAAPAARTGGDSPGAGGQSAHGVAAPTADPVKVLLERHRALCERAVDPLEIAAALEAHGITDRTAGRFRHRDVFALAEELYARTPRAEDDQDGRLTGPARIGVPDGERGRVGERGPGGQRGRGGEARRSATAEEIARPTARLPRWAPLALLPGAVPAAALAVPTPSAPSPGPLPIVVAVAGAVATAGALAGCLRYGPLRAAPRTGAPRPALVRALSAVRALLWCGPLPAAVLLDGAAGGPAAAGGSELLRNAGLAVPGGATAVLLALLLAVAPAAGCAHLFAVRARRGLAASRGLADFATATRPLLLGAVALFTTALGGLLALTATVLGDRPGGATVVGCLALGTLFFLARLLTVHGFARTAGAALIAGCTARALALAGEQAARLTGVDWLDAPSRAVTAAGGPGAVTALVCTVAALALLVRACALLTRASAHAGR
ncbi:hypothetical protein [Streptomyces sp. ODS05-4]|uniref:hypothetical protein n=1 Tax=Streptomyces sp. ODS05-4 TaxID=2944939 RepID=UPI0021097062|nr:hypothetical protein [Streptomyces sp. ODS05-4]